MATKDKAKKIISERIEFFDKHKREFKDSKYNEEKTIMTFIAPMFEALGWDFHNKQKFAPSQEEVRAQDDAKVDGRNKKPDFGFYYGKERLFFLEAKKPHENIKENPDYAKQLRDYGWNMKTPVSLLTDFEEFSVYDCTVEPKSGDKSSVACIKYLTYDKYLDKDNFDYIWDTFAKENVLKGSLSNLIKSSPFKKGSIEVDKRFLQSLEEWRKEITMFIFNSNKHLDTEELNFAVQQMLDRLLFLRICEGRSIEPMAKLFKIAGQKNAFSLLLEQFYDADKKYNSGLFDFKTTDTLTAKLKIEDNAISTLITKMYYPNVPYLFSVIPVEIIGNAYEQFLGNEIKVVNKKVTIEQKSEVRKAGGIFYTPQYIVNHIVANTLGKKIDEITANKRKATATIIDEVSKLKVLDPSCGSGSFLLGAYRYLLDWHKDFYTALQKDKKNTFDLKERFTSEGKLTTKEKKRILNNNIYGVDLDANAVEVTKLSLMLKVLEGETDSSLKMELFKEKALPNLNYNIRHGNSLIGIDLKDVLKVTPELKAQIHPFDWISQFKKVYEESKGFDVIIGNPPYARFQTLQEFQPEAVPYFKNKYQSAKVGNFDIYVLFIEKAYQLLNKTGVLGFIQPHKFFQADFGEGIRAFLTHNKALSEIVHFGAEQVFDSATTYTCNLFLDKKQNDTFRFTKVKSIAAGARTLTALLKNEPDDYETLELPQPKESTEKWNFAADKSQQVIDKLLKQPKTLADITRKIFVGLQTSGDKIYVLKKIKKNEKTTTCYSVSLEREVEIENGLIKPFLMGKDVKKYEQPNPLNVVIFPYLIVEAKAVVMKQDYLKKHFPKGWAYLVEHQQILEDREKGKMKHETFYAYIYPKNLAEFDTVKIMTPDIANQSQFTIDEGNNLYHTTTLYSFSFNKDIKEDVKYFLGVFNSPIMWFYLASTGNVLRGGYFRFKTEYLKPFPIKLIDFKDKSEKAAHDKIVKWVDEVLDLKQKQAKATKSKDIEDYVQEIAYTERQINEQVYKLYNLSEEEIEIIEK